MARRRHQPVDYAAALAGATAMLEQAKREGRHGPRPHVCTAGRHWVTELYFRDEGGTDYCKACSAKAGRESRHCTCGKRVIAGYDADRSVLTLNCACGRKWTEDLGASREVDARF